MSTPEQWEALGREAIEAGCMEHSNGFEVVATRLVQVGIVPNFENKQQALACIPWVIEVCGEPVEFIFHNDREKTVRIELPGPMSTSRGTYYGETLTHASIAAVKAARAMVR